MTGAVTRWVHALSDAQSTDHERGGEMDSTIDSKQDSKKGSKKGSKRDSTNAGDYAKHEEYEMHEQYDWLANADGSVARARGHQGGGGCGGEAGRDSRTGRDSKTGRDAKAGRDALEDAHSLDVVGRSAARSARLGARQDSWVDALVTLLATIVFGLGWTLVELERADSPLNGYDAADSKSRAAAVSASIEIRAIEAQASVPPMVESVRKDRSGDEDARWTELALQSSNR